MLSRKKKIALAFWNPFYTQNFNMGAAILVYIGCHDKGSQLKSGYTRNAFLQDSKGQFSSYMQLF